jgi:hypothetical protein
MKAEFEYTEEDVKEIILKHHNAVWGNFAKSGIWVVTNDYRGVIVRLEETPKEEETDES